MMTGGGIFLVMVMVKGLGGGEEDRTMGRLAGEGVGYRGGGGCWSIGVAVIHHEAIESHD